MSRISLNLSQETIKLISAIAKENDATISEVARYLIARGLDNFDDEEATETDPAITHVKASKQVEL